MIKKFLSDMKDSIKVEDMSALLETAIYRDILRRYVETDDFVSISTDQLLKLGLTYIKLSQPVSEQKLPKVASSEFAAKIAIETIAIIKDVMDSDYLHSQEMDEKILAALKVEFSGNSIDKFHSEQTILEELRSNYEIIRSS
ncbi:MAG: hypothetical protein ACN4E2_02445 [Nitrospinota bacterium]